MSPANDFKAFPVLTSLWLPLHRRSKVSAERVSEMMCGQSNEVTIWRTRTGKVASASCVGHRNCQPSETRSELDIPSADQAAAGCWDGTKKS
eukprot:s89_g44.t1